ncbi:hypothetical protein HPB48_002876 [Haemaphysalis longicornis]|uniref:TRAF1-6 MATH domain-containing protein n=1 Tax=Haemaphysalis longicornis TaxID=44386 RepID=A0A9J6FYP2_HAELO|nr:hypothetical protein HPB48_002876 [Haemaphysalis longicornis]
MVIVDQRDGGSADIVRTTSAASGCPDIALQKPAQELAEWSCGESRMASHAALFDGGYVRGGAMRVRFRVFLKEYASHVASVTVRDGALASEYLWELKEAAAKVALLTTGGFSKVESPVFYTANQGYALRMSLVLNRVTPPLQSLASNDDQRVLGVYFTLWKGRHDSVLRWPFPHLLTLAIVSPTAGRPDLSKTVDPTHARCPPEAFHRPQAARNDHACGFSAFLAGRPTRGLHARWLGDRQGHGAHAQLTAVLPVERYLAHLWQRLCVVLALACEQPRRHRTHSTRTSYSTDIFQQTFQQTFKCCPGGSLRFCCSAGSGKVAVG